MDTNKQFTEVTHNTGAIIDPNGAAPPGSLTAPAVPDTDATTVKSAANPPPATSSSFKHVLSKPAVKYGLVGLCALLFVGGGILLGKRFSPPIQMITNSSQLDKSTLYIDSSKNSVGVVAPNNPDGLQVGATVSAEARGTANVRLGLLKGSDPSLIFEDKQKNTWQVLGAGGSLQFIQGTTTRAKLDENALSLTNAINVGGDTNANANLAVKGNTTLGGDGNSLVTIQAAKVSTPNNLNIGNNALFVEANKGSVAIGATSASGYKLLVAGTLKVNSNLVADGQVLAAAGSAKSPSFSFNNNTNTGIYEAGLNVVGVSAAGNAVMQIQPGVAYTVNGANFEADGYLRAGRGGSNPSFQIGRFAGTLDGSGSATVADGLPNGYSRVLTVQAFYRGNSSEALPLNIDYVNGGSFQISGGIPGRQYRATIIYSQDAFGW